MKTYENFITDLFKSKMTAEKFTKFLIKFINSVIINDKVFYSYTHRALQDLISHDIFTTELEQPILYINETYEKNTIIIEFSKLSLTFAEGSGAIKTFKIIVDELKNIQEFIKDKIEPIIIDTLITNRQTKYFIKVSDIEKVMPDINKENYEAFLVQKKFNL